MDLATCLKKMELVGVLAFATVDSEGAPQIRNISAIHYEPNALYSIILILPGFLGLLFGCSPSIYPNITNPWQEVLYQRNSQALLMIRR